jgi:hypothetical protein
MSDNSHNPAQPGAKPTYTPPRVMRLGDLNEGAGACAAGSGVVTGNCETSGANATANCNNHGDYADALCYMNGAHPSGGCDTSGSTN